VGKKKKKAHARTHTYKHTHTTIANTALGGGRGTIKVGGGGGGGWWQWPFFIGKKSKHGRRPGQIYAGYLWSNMGRSNGLDGLYSKVSVESESDRVGVRVPLFEQTLYKHTHAPKKREGFPGLRSLQIQVNTGGLT